MLFLAAQKTKQAMVPFSSRLILAALGAVFLLSAPAALAQNAEPKAGEPQRQQPGENGKESQKVDDFAEATRVLAGPAGNPECVWLGRRVVSLLYRDDMDTAFRHLDLYDRFGCPAPHVQQTFRCLVRQGSSIDQKTPDTLNSRVHACWINPSLQPSAAATSGGTPAAPATAGSGSR
jgi:hypothetical protein